MSREQFIAQLRSCIIECLEEDAGDASRQDSVIVRNQNGYISHTEDGPTPSTTDAALSSDIDDDFLSARFDFSDPITFRVSYPQTQLGILAY